MEVVELPASDSGGIVEVAVDVHKKDNKREILREFMCVDAATGRATIEQVSRTTLMRRFHLRVRDLGLLDPLLGAAYPCSSILRRERAILCNLEQIRCVITADEVLLPYNKDPKVAKFVKELRRHLKRGEGGEDDEKPFELCVLEFVLEAACSSLDAEVTQVETYAYPALDELTSTFTARNYERVRHIKSRLLLLTRRVEEVRDEIEHLIEDDGAIAEMCLTEKKRRAEASSVLDEQALPGPSHSAPVFPVLSPSASRMHDNLNNLLGSRDVRDSKEEVEMMLYSYFGCIDGTLNKLTTLKQFIDDTHEYINCNLDGVRNQLMKFELLVNTSTFVTSILGVVLGIFGMNFEEPFFKVPHAFQWTLTITVVCGLVIFCILMCYFKKRGYFPY